MCSRLDVNPAGYRSSHGSLSVHWLANGTTTARSGGGGGRFFCLNRRCGFQMHFRASKWACGGTVSDDAVGFLILIFY
jgi:hypothetical protein